jgi:hypothetical protein
MVSFLLVISTVIAKLGKGANMTTDVLVKICDALDCDITEIMARTSEPTSGGGKKSGSEKDTGSCASARKRG